MEGVAFKVPSNPTHSGIFITSISELSPFCCVLFVLIQAFLGHRMRSGSHNSTFGPHHLWGSSPWMRLLTPTPHFIHVWSPKERFSHCFASTARQQHVGDKGYFSGILPQAENNPSLSPKTPPQAAGTANFLCSGPRSLKGITAKFSAHRLHQVH